MSNQGIARPTKLFNKYYVTVVVCNCVLQVAQTMIQNMFGKFINSFNSTAAIVGVVGSLFAFTAMLMRFVAGPAMQFQSKKKLAIIATFLLTVVYFGYAFATNVYLAVFWRLMQGVGQGMVSGCLLAMAAEAAPADKMGVAISTYSMVPMVFTAFAPTVALYIANNISWRAAFSVGAVLMGIAAILSTQMKYEYVRPEGQVMKYRLSDVVTKELLVPTFLMVLVRMVPQVFGTFLAIYAASVNPNLATSIGLYFTVRLWVSFACRPVVGRMSDKLGCVKSFVPIAMIYVCVFWIVSYATTLPMFLFAGLLAGFSEENMQPLLQSIMVKCVSDDKRGVASNASFLGTDVGSFLGNIVAGAVATAVGYTFMWRCMSGFLVLAIVIALLYAKKFASLERDYAIRNNIQK